MKITLWDNVCNVLNGTIKHVNLNTEEPEVTLEIAPGVEITSVVSRDLAKKLLMGRGKEAYLTIDASEVMIRVFAK